MVTLRNESEVREFIIAEICGIAPEVDPQTIDPDQALRDQVDLDSMDYLNLIVRVHEKLRIDIPESDYSKLRTLRGFVGYVKQRI